MTDKEKSVAKVDRGGCMPIVDCALCHDKIGSHEARWHATLDFVCIDCIATLVDDELNRRIDGQPSSITRLLAGDETA